MPAVAEEKSSALQELANAAFGGLSIAEQWLLRQTQHATRPSLKREGVTVDVEEQQDAVTSLQEGYDVSRSHRVDFDVSESRKRRRDLPGADTTWVRERSIRSELLHWLCTDRGAREYLNDFVINLKQNRVRGRLNLSYLDVPFPIICRACWFPDGIDLDGTIISHLDLDGSWIGPEQTPSKTTTVFSAEGLNAKGSVLLRRLHSEGKVSLIGAIIRGDLSCSGGQFNNASKTALVLDRADISGNLHLRDNFSANGLVQLVGAKIHGNFSCRSGTFENGEAIIAQGVTVNGSVFLCAHEDVEFEAKGRVSFAGARIDGDLNCRDGVFRGEFALYGADIAGQLICTGGRFLNPGGCALNADRAKIHGAVFLGFSLNEIKKDPVLQKVKTGFLAEGEVRLFATFVGNNLICHAGQCRNLGNIALNAEQAKITGGMMLRDGFDIEGEVRLFGAEVGGSLECSEASFRNPGKGLAALRIDRTSIGGAVNLSSGFRTEGNVLIHSATINKDLILTGADLKANGCELLINNSKIKGVLKFKEVQLSPNTAVDLRDTSCGVLSDDLKSWPLPGNLMLDGFVYRRLRHPDAVTRIDNWLRRQLPASKSASSGQFWPQPYRQLAAVLRAQGLDRDAKTVLIEMARDRRKWGKEGSRLRQWLLWVTIRNGYQPIRAGLLLILLWIFGYVAFGIAYNVHVMVPTDKDANPVFVATGAVPVNYEPFCAATYAIDTSLPIISFGQREKWHPAAPSKPAGTLAPDREGGILCDASPLGRFFHQIMHRWFHQTEAVEVDFMANVLPWFRWGYIAIGWFLTTMFVAGISGLVGRE